MALDLENIPPEIQGLIVGHLHARDQNSLSQTSKALNPVALAKIYNHVIIKVPIRWLRLESLENLLASAGSGLKFTRSICITAQQQPSKAEIQDSEDGRTAQEIAHERQVVFCLPKISATKALNCMIRLLLMRIPDNHLKIFDYRHSCALDTSTLALLIKHQGARLRGLSVTRYSEPRNVPSLLVRGLQSLRITDLNIEQRCEWPSKLIAQNRNTLRHLHLGIVSTAARNYAVKHATRQLGLPTSFAEMAKETLIPDEREMMPMLSLETLGLYGVKFENIVGGALGLGIDFNSMTALRLESCSGLNEAFAVLMGSDRCRNATLRVPKLTSFFVRHEYGDQAFAQHLAAFLTSFTGLEHLGLLLDRQRPAMRKAPILQLHGQTLQTLVWDERRKPRKDTRTDTSVGLKDNGFRLISLKCPNLTALGLSILWSTSNWKSTISPLAQIALRMPKLRTLHIRNLPETDFTVSSMPAVHMVESLASTVLDVYAHHTLSGQKSLTTIALGAPLYRDIHIGSKHFPSDPVREYLQLRVYHVDYKCQPVQRPWHMVTQVAQGTADDATTCLDKDVLHEYWLA